MRLTYIRWSMTIIEVKGLTIVTDPVFRILGIHQEPRSYTFDRMPRPDLVFVSHTHLDRFEPAVLRRFAPQTPVWMPSDKVAKASNLSLAALRGMREWESETLNGVRLTVIPAMHTGGELGLVVEAERTVYFAGDTSLDRELFRTIGQHWDLDAVLLPIGDLRRPTKVGLAFSRRHISPRTAPEALRLLGEPPVVVPTHYSGMTLSPFLSFWGTPRKAAQQIHRAGLGTVVGTTRPLETVEL